MSPYAFGTEKGWPVSLVRVIILNLKLLFFRRPFVMAEPMQYFEKPWGLTRT